jgi:CheY-like chemotaxis protein
MKTVNCILLIDDNEADNEFHSRAIKKSGVCQCVEVANGGQKALDYLLRSGTAESPTPDLIFLDINMPGMNGFEFLEEYNQLDPAKKSKMVVFMLTSSLLPDDKEKAEKTGYISAFLPKPLTAKMVGEIIDKYF